MAFVEGTQIFTNSGFKNIEDIYGHDKVLVRNFLGDALFMQPFALKKIKYDGEVVNIGAKSWNFTVTPNHKVVYDKKNRGDVQIVSAKEVEVSLDTRIYRKFRYSVSDEPKKEIIKVTDDFGTRHVTVGHHDWYKLVGYVLMRGFIRMNPGKPMLFLFLDEEKMEEEIHTLGDILDRIGVAWHVQYSEKTRPKIVVSSRNNLARRLLTRLGSKKRKTMYLPDTMVYSSSRELTRLLIETIIDASIKVGTERGDLYQLQTTNKALIDSLVIFGTLGGYRMRPVFFKAAGEVFNKGVTKNDRYILHIGQPTETYSPAFKKKSSYSGHVYEIDLFDGQVYVKNGAAPVWIDPK